MNPDIFAIFDPSMHLRATLSWKDDEFALESILGFDNVDLELFLAWLKDHNPHKRIEENQVMGIIAAPKNDPNYRNAVWQELKIRKFLVYPIQNYQKEFLMKLNEPEFDKVRQEMMGDLLTVSEEKTHNFVIDLREGIDIMKGLNDLE
jgi:hypothetical protein